MKLPINHNFWLFLIDFSVSQEVAISTINMIDTIFSATLHRNFISEIRVYNPKLRAFE